MTSGNITLSAEQQIRFEMAVKRGILKELHRAKLLTDMQLNVLLSDIQQKNICALNKNISGLKG